MFTFGLIIFILSILPLVKDFSSSTGARFGSVTVMNPSERLNKSIEAIEYDQEQGDFLGRLIHNRRIVYAREILAGYLDHFNFYFLFLSGDPPGRHHAVGIGMLYIWDLPFVLIGILYLLGKFNKQVKLIFLIFILAPVASSLTTGTPHAVRALLYVPIYQIFTACGLFQSAKKIKNSIKYRGFLMFSIFISLMLSTNV